MKLHINGDVKEFEQASLTIAELLSVENVDQPDMVSVQLNGEFVEKDAYATQTITDGNEVDFMYFMGGGSL